MMARIHMNLYLLSQHHAPSKPSSLRCVRYKPTNIDSVTTVGGTTNIPETAIFFSGGGFSNYVSLHSNLWFECDAEYWL